MKVYPISPRGYCKGVVRAIQIAKQQANKKDVYILGMIVHNQYIVDTLKNLGIKTLDKKGASRLELLDQVDHGTIIITAHGVDEKVIKKAKEKKLEVIDATCLDVIKTHDLIKEYLAKDYEVLYIGKNGHPESEGSLGIDPKHIHLIEQNLDIDKLDPNKNYVITNQTTMSLYDVYQICNYAKEKLPNLTIAKETCQATTIRQEAIAKIPQEVDIVFIVGDPHSNNTKKLANIAKEKSLKETYMIESVHDIDIELLKNKKIAAVSSGASTPTYLTNQVIEYLNQFDYQDHNTYQKPELDMSKII